jgi:tetratricopeptide (TPR) repeat protein
LDNVGESIMRRLTTSVLLIALLMSATLAGCSRQVPAPPAPPPPKEVPVVLDNGKPDHPVPDKPKVDPDKVTPPVVEVAEPAAPELTADEKYDAALLAALNLLADQKYSDALAAFETARGIKDTETVQREIERLKGILAERAAAEKTLQDIETVLGDGKAEEASKLAASALLQYGDTEWGPQLAKLKRQADTLIAAGAANEAARRDHFRKEGEAALKDKNLRAAALAFERSLQYGSDADVRKQHDEVRATLARYDDNRKKAAELRQNPANLEEAIALLEDAAKAWDTLQVRQEIQEYTLALQKRRDRVTVADFEVRGDVGVEFFGRTLAEELLPQFKNRYDLVDRSQLGKVLEELKLDPSDLADNDEGRREVGKLAKVRYLVLGSVARLSGLRVNARLVDMDTGLVVQTAQVAARDPGEVVKLVPRLANLLLMTDEQKAVYGRKLAEAEARVEQVGATAKLPPPPEMLGADRPLPPLVVVWSVRPPVLGELRVEDLDKLPAAPKAGQLPPPLVVAAEKEEKIKQRLLQLVVELGDNLFQRGNYRQANGYYDLALNLYPDDERLTVRSERCRPFLPPAGGATGARHPRVAVLDFLVVGDARVAPPSLSWWTADNIGPYLSPTYDVVERGELFWYMNRLGLSAADLHKDPSARRWLARALNVRGFLFGSVREARGLTATAHLVDADYGYEVGGGRINVRDAAELKLRLGELARLVLMGPAERERYLKDAESYRSLLADAGKHSDAGKYDKAIDAYQQALKLRPGNVEVLVMLQKTREKADRQAREEAERKERERQKALRDDWQRRQFLLARAAEEARILANLEFGKQADAERKAQDERKQKAYDQLMIQGRDALKNKKYQQAITLFETATGLKPNDAGLKELAQARAQADDAAEAERRIQEELDRQKRELALRKLRDQLEEDRRRREQEAKAREARDHQEIQTLVAQAQQQLFEKKYDDAIITLQSAQKIRKTEEVEKMLADAQAARAIATQKDADARAKLEKRLAEEKAKREVAEVEARRKREQYDQALRDARAAVKEKRYAQAIAKFQDALQIARTDSVLGELKQAQAAADKEKADADEAKRKQDAEKKRTADLEQYLKDGKAALEAKPPQYDKAVQAFAEAKKLDPKNIDAMFGFDLAVQGRDKETARLKQEAQRKQEEAKFKKLLADGKANLDAKQYDAAVEALTEALHLNPTSADAKTALADAKKGQAGQDADAKQKAEKYRKWMEDGKVALAAGKYPEAIKAFEEAQKLFPKDPTSADLLKDAKAARDKDKTDLAQKAKEAEEARQKAAKVEKALERGRVALKAGDLKAAREAFKEAADLSPKSGAVLQAQKELVKAEEDRVKRLAEFQTHLDAGQKALKEKRPEEAVKEAQAALLLDPQQRKAQDLLRDAQAALKIKQDAEAATLKLQQLLTRIQTEIKAGQLDAAAKDLAEAKKLAAPADQAVAQAERDLQAARRAPFDKLVTQGKAALKDKKYDDAVKAFTDALKIMDDKDTQALLKDAQTGVQFTKLLTQGKAANDAKKWDEAITAYNAALKLVPNDPEATKGLQTANDGKKGDAAVVRANFDKLMGQGKTALKDKKYDDAVKAFTDALKLIDDKEARALLKQAQDEQKNLAEYTRQINLGKIALNAGKWDEAITAYNAALKLVPNDPEATKGLQAATDGKKKADSAGRRANFDKLVAQGKTALKDKKYDDAVKALTEALKLITDDKEAQGLLKDAQAGADFTKLVAQGKAAMAVKKYDDAVKAFTDAVKLMPADKEAPVLLKQAQDEQKKRADYTRQMTLGNAALKDKKWDDAIAAFSAALKLVPNDPEATKGLQAANDGKKPKANPAEYAKQMAAAGAAEKKQEYLDALAAYQKALEAMPNDVAARAGVKKGTDYNQRMIDGKKALDTKKWADAVKAYEEALKLYPESKEAMRNLQKAKDKKP